MTDFPTGLRLVLDRSVRAASEGRVLVGGDPLRVLTLSASGPAAVTALCRVGARTRPEARLARVLVDGGLAHPLPDPVGAWDTTIVVPVRDRPQALDRCLAAAGAAAVVVDDGSHDPAAIAAVCARHGAQLVRIEVSGGPAAARNAGIARVSTPYVAFLDSDCVPAADWLRALAGHFADLLVAAVAPRVRGARAAGAGAIGRFAAARSPLDLGTQPARVMPGGRVAYVPTAALIVRRDALGSGFDPDLRYGEDVDLIWRLDAAGWRVRYDPSVAVDHAEPVELVPLLARRFRYGLSAAPLARRHPGHVAPLVLHAWPATITGFALARRPIAASVAVGLYATALSRRLVPAGVTPWGAIDMSLRAAGRTFHAAARAATTLAPLALLAGLSRRRTRGPALALLMARPLAGWADVRPDLDPLRWTALSLADEAAYGAGVWAGAIRERQFEPLVPTTGSPTSRGRRHRPGAAPQ